MELKAVRARLPSVLTDGRAIDAGIAVVLTVMAQVQLPPDGAWWMRVALGVTTMAVAWRGTHPVTTAAIVAASVAVMGLSAEPPSVFGEYLALMLASYTVGARRSTAPAALGLALLLAGIVAHDWRSPEFGGLSGFLSDSAVPVVIWLVGRAVSYQRGRADLSQQLVRALEAEQGRLAQAAVAEERLRLARELHDVVTHTISVMVIQAEGAQKMLERDPAQVRRSLEVIEQAGRSTMTEMRRLLGLLRDGGASDRAPQPGLADLRSLIAQVEAAGLPVTMTSTGREVQLDPGLDLTAYRIVQESLTNSLKHARPATATVALRWQPDRMEIVATDDGAAPRQPNGTGRGLIGMRERVLAYGGELEAGPAGERGFRVRCMLPLGDRT